MRILLRRLVLALQFLTRIPIRANLDIGPGEMGGSFAFYPLVGALVGALAALPAWGAYVLTSSALAAAAFLVLAMLLLTGGFHIDGLGDAADGLYAGRGDRERTLAVMKDSRVGAMAVMAIAVDLLLRAALASGLTPDPRGWYLGAIAACFACGRLGIVTAAACSRPASAAGLSGSLLGEVGWKQWLPALLIAAAVTLPLLGVWRGLACLALSQVVPLLASWRFTKRLGGLTGDLLGLVNEICELGCLFVLLIHW